jgi:hypothetical protein
MAPWCVSLWPLLPSVFLFLMLTFQALTPNESGPWLGRLETSTYVPRFIFLVLQVFSGGCARENFLTLAMGNIYSKISLTHPWGVFYTILPNWV